MVYIHNPNFKVFLSQLWILHLIPQTWKIKMTTNIILFLIAWCWQFITLKTTKNNFYELKKGITNNYWKHERNIKRGKRQQTNGAALVTSVRTGNMNLEDDRHDDEKLMTDWLKTMRDAASNLLFAIFGLLYYNKGPSRTKMLLW